MVQYIENNLGITFTEHISDILPGLFLEFYGISVEGKGNLPFSYLRGPTCNQNIVHRRVKDV